MAKDKKQIVELMAKFSSLFDDEWAKKIIGLFEIIFISNNALITGYALT